MKLSVVVATRNRSANLADLLGSLLNSDCPPGLEWDAWIVDNNSTDDTRRVIEEFSRRAPDRIHYLFEAGRGKSKALNCGIRSSAGEIVVFTDDDCIPDKHWLTNIARAFAVRSEVGILGGRIELHNPADRPVTIRTWLDRRTLTSASDIFFFIAGCNMAIRRHLLDAVGEFDPNLCPGSPKDTVADDPDYIYRAFRMGVTVEYDPEILVFHNHGRRTDEDVAVLRRKYLRGRGAFYAKHIAKGDRTVLKLAYWEIRAVISALFKNLMTGKSARGEWQVLWSLWGGMVSRFAP